MHPTGFCNFTCLGSTAATLVTRSTSICNSHDGGFFENAVEKGAVVIIIAVAVVAEVATRHHHVASAAITFASAIICGAGFTAATALVIAVASVGTTHMVWGTLVDDHQLYLVVVRQAMAPVTPSAKLGETHESFSCPEAQTRSCCAAWEKNPPPWPPPPR